MVLFPPGIYSSGEAPVVASVYDRIAKIRPSECRWFERVDKVSNVCAIFFFFFNSESNGDPVGNSFVRK